MASLPTRTLISVLWAAAFASPGPALAGALSWGEKKDWPFLYAHQPCPSSSASISLCSAPQSILISLT